MPLSKYINNLTKDIVMIFRQSYALNTDVETFKMIAENITKEDEPLCKQFNFMATDYNLTLEFDYDDAIGTDEYEAEFMKMFSLVQKHIEGIDCDYMEGF